MLTRCWRCDIELTVPAYTADAEAPRLCAPCALTRFDGEQWGFGC